MKKLYLGNSDKQFKFADTTTEIHLKAFDDGSAATLTAGARVRIKNDSGYLLGISASITDNHAVITSGQLTQLPAGSYLIELWDTVDGGTAIYPSDGFLTLQINENVTGLSGGLVSSITVDDFVQQFSSLSEKLKSQVSDAVANGLKGDAGPVASDGTISLPMLDDQIRSNFVTISEFTPQLSGVGGVNIADGKVTDFGTQPVWTHAQYNVTGNSKLYVSFGKSFNTLVTGHIFATDDNNKILSSFVPGSGEQEILENYGIVTPAGTTKLFVQSYKMPGLSVRREVYQSLSKSIDQLRSNFVTISGIAPQLSGVGGVNVVAGKVTDFGTQPVWTHAQYNVTGNSKLYVSFGKSFNTLVTGHIFATDDNNKILASFVPGSGEQETLKNYEIVTPAGTTKLFVQSYKMPGLSVGKETYQSLSKSIEKSNIDLKQEIDNELKIYEEINNSNIYNFISRQGTLGGYPENSNKAVLNVKQNGFNSVRVSVAFTSDNVPVLIHGASINRVARNSDGSAISGTINIADITLEQANTYDWGIASRHDCKGMKIPLLSDFLKICSFKSIFPTLEFKPSTATDEQLSSIINMVNKYGLTNKTRFTSNHEAILSSVNKLNPSINIGFIAHLNSNVKVDTALKFKTEFNDVRIDMFDSDTPSIDVINYASSKGVGIKVGSAYSLADIVKFASMGVTDIEVAYVAFPATALNEYYDNL